MYFLNEYHDTALSSRRPLDRAEGILMALRHCSADEAFREIIGVSQRNGIPVFTLAAGLISTAVGKVDGTNPFVVEVVRIEWGELLHHSQPMPSPSPSMPER